MLYRILSIVFPLCCGSFIAIFCRCNGWGILDKQFWILLLFVGVVLELSLLIYGKLLVKEATERIKEENK